MHKGEWNRTHGGSKTRLYRIWKQMRIRCRCESNPTYRYYGARGISICPEWEDFAAFRTWALSHGYADDLTIDRIDSDGDYTPDNCRWVTGAYNAKYKRDTKLYTHDGLTMGHNDWAKYLGINQATLTGRIKRHGVEYALSMQKSNHHGNGFTRTARQPSVG